MVKLPKLKRKKEEAEEPQRKSNVLEKLKLLLNPPVEEEKPIVEEGYPIVLRMFDETTPCIAKYNVMGLYEVCITDDNKYLVNDLTVTPEEEPRIRELKEGILREHVTDTETYLKRIPGKFRHIIERELVGFSILQPLMDDDKINNIHIHSNRPVQVVHMEYDRLVYPVVLSTEKVKELQLSLAKASGVFVSERKPLMSFIDVRTMSRISGVFPSDVTLRKNAYLDIRKQPPEPWNVFKLMELETLYPTSAAVLWLAILYKLGILVVGEMYTGKTTLINALMSFMPPGARVMTIEDAPELRVPSSSYWVQTMPRLTVDDPESRISAFDILKTAVRMSVDYVIVGEVRGEEARYWAQAIMIGHGGLCLPEFATLVAKIDDRFDIYTIKEIIKALENHRRVEVFTINENGEVVSVPIRRGIIKRKDKVFVDIYAGRTVITVHRKHKLAVLHEGRVRFIEAEKIQPGMKLVRYRINPTITGNKEYMNLVEELPEGWCRRFYASLPKEIAGRVPLGKLVKYIAELGARRPIILARKFLNGEPIPVAIMRSVAREFNLPLEKAMISYYMSKPMKANIRLDEKFGKILGYLVTRGVFTARTKYGTVSQVAVRVKDPNTRRELKEYAEKVLGLHVREKGSMLYVVGATFAMLTSIFLGRKRTDMYIPLKLILYSNEKFRKALLETLLNGKKRIRVSSKKLAESIVVLAETLGYKAHYIFTPSDNRYVIYIDGEEATNDTEVLTVRAVKKREIDSLLYDIEVEPTHTYLLSVDGILSHNTSFHAAGPELALTRLSTEPINVDRQALLQLPVIVYIIPYAEEGRIKRKVQVFFNNTSYNDKYWKVAKVCEEAECDEKELLRSKSIRELMNLRGLSEDDILEQYYVMREILKARKKIPFDDTPMYLYSKLIRMYRKPLPVKIKLESVMAPEERTIELRG
ncbi:MAG: Flp pilus assembly complex ATPase component [Crenarchaeota archaeon]|nr:Flp pilus assembly complex ATPase component [Thermoproteota archaeon]